MKNIIIALLLLFSVGAIAVAAYFYGKSNQLPNTTTAITNITTATTSPTASATPTANQKGVVTGRLCYPSSMLPKGQIVAKNTISGEVFNQDYPGSQNGGASTYNFTLPSGSYYLKYDATGPSGIITGFYTDYSICVDNPNNANCSGQKTRPVLEVDIKDGQTTKDINLCDFYYPSDSPPKF